MLYLYDIIVFPPLLIVTPFKISPLFAKMSLVLPVKKWDFFGIFGFLERLKKISPGAYNRGNMVLTIKDFANTKKSLKKLLPALGTEPSFISDILRARVVTKARFNAGFGNIFNDFFSILKL